MTSLRHRLAEAITNEITVALTRKQLTQANAALEVFADWLADKAAAKRKEAAKCRPTSRDGRLDLAAGYTHDRLTGQAVALEEAAVQARLMILDIPSDILD